jgi:hypothetical protein
VVALTVQKYVVPLVSPVTVKLAVVLVPTGVVPSPPDVVPQ